MEYLNNPRSSLRYHLKPKYENSVFVSLHRAKEKKNKYNMNQSPSFKGYMPSKTIEKNAPDRDTFLAGSDYTDPGQHFIKAAPPGSVSQNQWPDEELPELRSVFYQYCKLSLISISFSHLLLLIICSSRMLYVCKATYSYFCAISWTR